MLGAQKGVFSHLLTVLEDVILSLHARRILPRVRDPGSLSRQVTITVAALEGAIFVFTCHLVSLTSNATRGTNFSCLSTAAACNRTLSFTRPENVCLTFLNLLSLTDNIRPALRLQFSVVSVHYRMPFSREHL